jgi:hypothetical protein
MHTLLQFTDFLPCSDEKSRRRPHLHEIANLPGFHGPIFEAWDSDGFNLHQWTYWWDSNGLAKSQTKDQGQQFILRRSPRTADLKQIDELLGTVGTFLDPLRLGFQGLVHDQGFQQWIMTIPEKYMKGIKNIPKNIIKNMLI